ncbi:terpenoid synthase [Rhizopogon vinicolor AM-OR11-026]|uniref:Terpene synthase n=1 Tax=Rhizopogon vinicolor AM-OR11-026 TaxID=1314800 RepID=A0A1B7N2X8_9AGAM|nr:terpenoid synthase [Rhizopogon vinicolor AM-OR11-026]
MARMIYLPDTMTNWPWPRIVNPHFEAVKLEVDASIRDFKALSPESQEAFDKCDFEHLRIGCDLMNAYFIIVGRMGLNPMVASSRFWARAIQSASLPSQRRFLDSFIAYLRALVVEAFDRDQGHCRGINGYLRLRRDTCSVKPCCFICEIGMDLPDKVLQHPIIVELEQCILELSLIDNDMASYNREQATGDENYNLITAVMLELDLDVGGAMAWAARYHAEVQTKFVDALTKIPSWGLSVDGLIKEYIDGIAIWTRGTHSWNYETECSFGPRVPGLCSIICVQLCESVENTM